MIRNLAEVALLFALPFIVYFAAVLARGKPIDALAPNHSKHVPKLALAGILCAAIGILGLGLLESRRSGAYVPAVYKDGRLVPGHLE